MSGGPLHPRRVQHALEWLGDASPDVLHEVGAEAIESATAALKLIQKAQQGVGLSSAVVDAGAHALGIWDYVKKGLPRR
jgi:hypothetical protein